MEAFLMVIYPPNNSRARFEQPKWANQTTEQQPMQYEAISPTEQYTYTAGEMDNNTLEAAQEISEAAIEAARDKAQVKFIMANTESICAWRKLAQSQ